MILRLADRKTQRLLHWRNVIALLALVGIVWTLAHPDLQTYITSTRLEPPPTLEEANVTRTPKFAMLSMSYGENPLYERAMTIHRAHAQRHGYEMRVLTEDIAEGYWNKPTFLAESMATELSKPPDEQVDWFM